MRRFPLILLTSFTLFEMAQASIKIDSNFLEGKTLFEKRCSSCHLEYIDADTIKENFFKRENRTLNLKAPTVNMINWAINRGPKRIGEDDDLDFKITEVTEFLIDYLYNPDREKSICDKKILSYLPKKESLKGKITEREIEKIAHYLVKYKPKNRGRNIYKREVSLKDLIEKAKSKDRYILVEVSSKLCHYCMKMKKDVISTEKFQRFLKDNYLFKEIVVEEESLPYSLAKEYKGVTPTFFILDSSGRVIDFLIGVFNLDDFISKLKMIKEKS